MKLNYKKIISIFCLVLSLIEAGCLKDEIPSIPDISLNSSVELLHYLEARGDFINTGNCPALVEASDVHANISQYLLIDIQTPSEYNFGHIENAANVKSEDLVKVLDSIGVQNKKVVIISRNGQSSAYYASLLRLYGFNNVYSLNFGMAAWHSNFNENWQSATSFFNRDTLSNVDPVFVSQEGVKNKFTKLPEIQFDNAAVGIEERLKDRIRTLLKEKFSDSNEDIFFENDLSISRDALIKRFLEQNSSDYIKKDKNDYIVCYGDRDSYTRVEIELIIGHLKGTLHYYFPSPADLSSSRNLQTLPTNRTILVYSYDGQLSAFATAYLRLLGYKASSMLFGLNTLYPDRIGTVPSLQKYAFQMQPIYDYPYVSGN